MKESILTCLFMLAFLSDSFSQTGIGTTDPNGNAALEITSTSGNKGVLIPRVALQSTVNFSPLSAHIPGMIIYNTTPKSDSNDVSPGFYYNDGSTWVRVPGVNEVDMTDDPWVNDFTADGVTTNDLVKLKTKSDGTTERTEGTQFVIKDDGKVGIGTTSPTETLDINGKLKVRTVDNLSPFRNETKVLTVKTESSEAQTVTQTRMIDVLQGAGILVKQEPYVPTSPSAWRGIRIGRTASRLTFIGRVQESGGPIVSVEMIYRPGPSPPGATAGFTFINSTNCTVSQISLDTLRISYESHDYDLHFTRSTHSDAPGDERYYDVTTTYEDGVPPDGSWWYKGPSFPFPLISRSAHYRKICICMDIKVYTFKVHGGKILL